MTVFYLAYLALPWFYMVSMVSMVGMNYGYCPVESTDD